ncbi:MAG: cytochrome B [Bacteroidia bacterium]|nr:cytochrome B [Bacteroidota bacterium]MBP9083053.1 cytochrome B [Bacteroidia bacterium]MBK7968696.1 cytochrome B [Bacteroidota bacterium]MBK8875792.1 cytochrome B [Bacteroidota bacterium]MBK9045476.1 cytochrome B [Bacteroidota bacterium]
MYTGLLHTHSLVRWLMLILLIMSVFRAYNGWKSRRTFTPGDKKLVLFTLIFSHVQLLIGFVLYMVSPIVQSALADMGSAMKDKMLRFWAVEHIAVMILSILIITVGNAMAKRATSDGEKFKKIFIYFTIGLVLILISIPWPFLQTGAGRGWF